MGRCARWGHVATILCESHESRSTRRALRRAARGTRSRRPAPPVAPADSPTPDRAPPQHPGARRRAACARTARHAVSPWQCLVHREPSLEACDFLTPPVRQTLHSLTQMTVSYMLMHPPSSVERRNRIRLCLSLRSLGRGHGVCDPLVLAGPATATLRPRI